MGPSDCWLLLFLTLIPAWEVVYSQNCPESTVRVIPVNTTALKVVWINLADGFELIKVTLGEDTIETNDNQTDVIFSGLGHGQNYNVSIIVEYTNCSFNTTKLGTTKPSPVTGLSVVNRTTESLKIKWKAPNDTGASNYTYNITVTSDTGPTQTHSTGPGETMFTAKGLDPGVQYNLRVESVTPENTLSAPENVNGTTKPSPVTGLSVVNRTTESLKIKWKAPNDTGASNYTYNITVTSDTGPTQTHSTGPGKTMFTVTGLDPGVQYNLRVESVTPENTLSAPENVNGTTKPSPVTGLSVVNRTTESLKIKWKAPNDTGASNYTYNITVTSDTGPTQTHSTGPGKTMFTVTGLDPGVQYNLRVESVTPENTLSAPENVNGTTNPSPVTALFVWNRTTESLEIKWTAPNDTRASNYTYNITVTNDTAAFTQTHSTGPGKTMFTAKGLDPGVQYNLRVESVTPENTLSAPENVNGTTKPSPVTGLSVVNRTTESLKIKWKAPNDTRASNYTYNITVTSDTGPTQTHSTGPGKTMFTAKGLDPGVQYNLRVESVTPENTLSAPENVNGTTKPSPVTGLSVVDRTTESLKIKWKAPNDTKASNYSYNITVTSDTGPTQTHSTGPGKTMFTVTGLDPGVQYNLRVESVTPENTLSAPENVNGTTKPSPVTGLSVVNRTTESLKIKWKAPNDTGASNYTYNITVTSDTGPTQTHSTGPGKTMFTVTGLDPGVQYNLRVESVTPENTLSAPENVNGTTNPSPVTALFVWNRTTESLEIKWTAPNDTRASNYTYNITVTNDTAAFTQTHSTGPGKTMFTAKGLDPGVQYNLKVESVTPENTLSAPENVNGTTKPSPVTGLSVVNRTTESLKIKWKAPNDTRASNYTYNITVTSDTGPTQTHSTGPGKTMFTAKGLDPGVQYNLRVESVTPENTLSAPENVNGTTKPSPVAGLSVVNRTTESLKIKWKAPNDTGASNYTYNITVTSDTGPTQTHSTGPGETMFTVTGLDPGVQYNLRVDTVTPENTLSATENVNGTTNPSPVTALSVRNRTTESLEIKWTAPNDTRVSVYTYNITVTNDTGAFTQTHSTGPGETVFTAKGLDPGVQYNLRVESVTPENTLSAPENVKGTTIPGAVSEIRCAQSTGYTIKVEWAQPKGNFTGFNVSAYDGPQILKVHITSRDKNTLTIESLQPGRKYTVNVYTQTGQSYSKKVTTQCWTSSSPIIIGAVVGSLLGLSLIGLLLFFIITKYRPWSSRKQPDSEFSALSTNPIEFKPVPVSEYGSYFQRKHADTDFGFAEEYQSLSTVGTEKAKDAALLVSNKGKNRYTNVLPYDASRVKLVPQPESSTSDYINANYMPGYKSDKEFIAAQGPLPSTVADFWRMIWEQKSQVIVMLTNCMELNRVKCEHYWPMDYTSCTYGDITVTVTSETILPEWTLRDFSIKEARHSGTRSVSHFHFTAWPDHGVPQTTEKVIEFQQLIRDHLNRNRRGLPVVHCSAGVGRTGTLIALDYLLQQIQQEAAIDVHGIVHKMRQNRPLMVQTEPQYVFLHQCMLDTIQPNQPEEAIYENRQDLIYENVGALNAAGAVGFHLSRQYITNVVCEEFLQE